MVSITWRSTVESRAIAFGGCAIVLSVTCLAPMLFSSTKNLAIPSPERALPGHAEKMAVAPRHVVLGTPMEPPFPPEMAIVTFGMGCFWGAEKKMWERDGVHSTHVGYGAGFTPNPTYGEVCSGRTGHAEVVRVVFDPSKISFDELLRVFWEGHDPTQGMRQGNDVGTQYRSGIYVSDAVQERTATMMRATYAERLARGGHGAITTEIVPAGEFFYAEDEHQQYLAKNPRGYCGLGGTGVTCPLPAAVE
jgi:peptide-methionine (S)-S-oxide reductase